MILGNNQEAFFALLRAGLWETDVQLLPYGDVDYMEVYRISEEQEVEGLVTAGMEYVKNVIIPQQDLLTFIGNSLQLEQRNKAMNEFVARLIDKLRKNDVYCLLVKGQGVAQCYEKPMWRAAGDIDLYLSSSNYEKAKSVLFPIAESVEHEDKKRLHQGMEIGSWVVELHGSLHTGISRKINAVLDEVHHDLFYNGSVRSWNNNRVQIFLPDADNDVIIIFSHFINHFYGEGVGLRQICDWCRLLWSYREKINKKKLELRLKKMGLMTEWRAFAAFAVEYLGMPVTAMPFYSDSSSFSRKARRICKVVLETGSFGVNNEVYCRNSSSKMKYYILTFWTRLKGFSRLSTIFPVNAPRFFVTYTIGRITAIL